MAAILLLLLANSVLLGCRATIPPGAEVTRLVIGEDSMTLEPSTVSAGDVYFEVEGPSEGLVFVTGMADGPQVPPFSDAAIARLVRDPDDTEGTASVDATVLDGIVTFKGVSALSPGKYAFTLEVGPGADAPLVAVLTVVP